MAPFHQGALAELTLIFGKSKFERTSELFKPSKVLNVYVLKIFNTAVFMHKIPEKSMLNIFLLKFRRPSHSYTTRFSHVICVNPIAKLNDCKYKISYRGPFLWNNISTPRIHKSPMSLN